MLAKLLLSATCATTLSACGSFVPIQNIDKAGIDTVLAASRLPMVDQSQAGKLRSLGEVVGHSCMNKATETAATKVGAQDQAKILAIQKGATAITSLSCSEGGVSLIKNCWQSWECKAIALQ